MYFLNCHEKWKLSNIYDLRDVHWHKEPTLLPTCDLHILAHWQKKLVNSTNKTGNLGKCKNSAMVAIMNYSNQ